jgi:hypothetical protein
MTAKRRPGKALATATVCGDPISVLAESRATTGPFGVARTEIVWPGRIRAIRVPGDGRRGRRGAFWVGFDRSSRCVFRTFGTVGSVRTAGALLARKEAPRDATTTRAAAMAMRRPTSLESAADPLPANASFEAYAH